MSEEIVYIAETKSFIINGKIIKESELPLTEVINLKNKIKKNYKLIMGESTKCSTVIL